MSNTQLDQINSQGAGALMGAYQPGDPYASLYDNGEYNQAAGQYYDAQLEAINREREQASGAMQHELEWAIGGLMGDNMDLYKNGILYMDPVTNMLQVDQEKAKAYSSKGSGSYTDLQAGNSLERAMKTMEHANKSLSENENWNRLRSQKTSSDQRQAAINAERARTLGANQGFKQEMGRMDKERAGYEGRKATNLMTAYMDPALAQAGNAAMGAANSTAGGSLGQAAARRAAMTGFGQQSAQVVPQAIAQQGAMDMQQLQANDAMAQQYANMRQQAIQNQFQNNMATSNQNFGQQMSSLAFQKGTAKDISDQQRQAFQDAMQVGGQIAGGGASMMTGFGGMARGGQK